MSHTDPETTYGEAGGVTRAVRVTVEPERRRAEEATAWALREDELWERERERLEREEMLSEDELWSPQAPQEPR